MIKKTKKILTIIGNKCFIGVFFFTALALSAQRSTNDSSGLVYTINDLSGGIQSIVNKKDKYQMNWILNSDSTQYPWQTAKYAWGCGYGYVNGDSISWCKPVSLENNNDTITVNYYTRYFKIEVKRSFNINGYILESYRFTNNTDNTITISDMGIYTPYNDNYPDAKTCVESRCNTHIWTGENASYVFAERMGGEGPHLGLVLTEGSLKSYEILNRSRNIYAWKLSGSNVRGTIALNPKNLTFDPKQSYLLRWVIFPAENWDDFYAKAKNFGFVKASAKNYVVEKKEPLQATFKSGEKLKNVKCFLNGIEIPFEQNEKEIKIDVIPTTEGEQILNLEYNNDQSTFIRAYRIEDIKNLLQKRAQFIVEKQQLNDTSDPRYGAYLVYDNERGTIYLNDDSRKSSDTNEGRERLGMGIFLAMYLQLFPDEDIQASLMRYYEFVRNKLQRDDYSVRDGLTSKRRRFYNYTWVAHFYLEMYKLTNDKKYLTDYFHTQHKYFEDSGYKFYAIDIPVTSGLAELKKAKMNQEYDILLEDYCKSADNYIKTSIYYPKSEVNYEQSIVAPSVVFLLEVYQITKENKYLKEAKIQLKVLETFGGFQPDYHLNNIAIRHWDGYWFGKYQFWGDVFPHYWSAITSEAYARYSLITGNREYMDRAKTIVRNNLCQFFEDGSASCAYIYPSKVNGKNAAFFDPFANDQDWALVYYLKYLRLNNK